MRNPLKTSAYCGLYAMIIPFVLGTFSAFLSIFDISKTILTMMSMLNLIVSSVLFIFFVYGFVLLGRNFNAKLLVVMSWIGIIVSILGILFVLISSIFSLINPVSALSNATVGSNLTTSLADSSITNPALLGGLGAMFVGFLIIYVVISIVAGIYSILFGVGLLKLKNDVKYAKVAAIWNIVSGATYIIFIGWLLQFVALIFELMLMFKASEDFEVIEK